MKIHHFFGAVGELAVYDENEKYVSSVTDTSEVYIFKTRVGYGLYLLASNHDLLCVGVYTKEQALILKSQIFLSFRNGNDCIVIPKMGELVLSL